MQLLAKSADAEKKRQKAALQDRLHKKRERRMRDLQHKHELELQTKTDAHSVEASEIQDRLDDHDDLVSGRVGTVVYGGVLWFTVVYCGVLCVYCGVLCVYGAVLWCTVVYCGVLWCTAGVLLVVQLGVSTTIGHSIQIQRVTVEVVVTRAIFVHLLV